MVKTVEFLRFRGFERLRAELTPHAYIVGPNSAGKSTVLEALGLAERCLRIARRKNSTSMVARQTKRLRAFAMPPAIDNEEDPVRYEFGTAETRVSVHWSTGARIHMVWPAEVDGEASAYFYLEDPDGAPVLSANEARRLFDPLTVVPVVTPLDRFEELKNPTYVEAQAGTRLASRHFRNHAWLMKRSGEWPRFKAFSHIWLPEIELLDVSLDAAANRLAVFYNELGSRVPKELAWAGDGIQIWVQLLWHLFRVIGATTVVLDEPEVYLHPDLQRRLVRLLDTLSVQVVLASHSGDVIAEAPADGILWVDRRIGGARRAKSQQTLAALSVSLGSTYNLALARSMRARLVIATDCQDVRVIRQLAKHVGAANVANEHLVSIVQLREVSAWSGTGSIGSSLREVLPARLPAVVLLQAGHRPSQVNDEIAANLSAPDVTVTFLTRAEIENHLLDSEVIARVSGSAREVVTVHLTNLYSQLRDVTRSAFTAAWVAAAPIGRTREALEAAETYFDLLWDDVRRRIELVRGALVIDALNVWLESQGYRAVSSLALAKSIRPQSIDADLMKTLLALDEMVAP